MSFDNRFFPFSELWVDENHKQRTSEAKNTNNPVYNETFAFTVRQGVKHKLYLKVKDKDILGTDKIGEAKIDLQDVFNGSVFDEWYLWRLYGMDGFSFSFMLTFHI